MLISALFFISNLFLTPHHDLYCHQITELLFNITKHIVMPKHEMLNAVEKQRLLSEYKVEDKKVVIIP